MIFLLRTPEGDVVARTSLEQRIDGREGTYEKVAEIPIQHEGRLSTDNPDVQKLLCDTFIKGAQWQKKHPKKKVEVW